jgi:hypothetical protein
VPDPLAASARSSVGHRPTRSESAIMSGNDVPNSRNTDPPSGSTTEEEEDAVVVIPRLGSSVEEEDVRRLLGSHGIRATRPRRHSSRRTLHPEDEDMEMTDVEDRERTEDDAETNFDEVDTERLSSDLGSRGGSPNPVTIMPTVHSIDPSSGLSSVSHSIPELVREYTRHRSSRYLSSTVSGGSRSFRQPPPYSMLGRVTSWDEQKEASLTSEDNLDLAGTCFDPTGSYIYVGSVKGVVEYRVRGAEKRWWKRPQWA